MVKPDRDPDFTLGLWQFYFDQMVQYHSSEERCYKIKFNKYNDGFLWWCHSDETWNSYGEDAEAIYSGYVEFDIEKTLLT